MSREKSNIFRSTEGNTQNIGVGGSELEVTALSAGGRGIGLKGGLVWFVPNALPGDRVLALPEKRRKRYVEARRIGLLRPSNLRREPPCPYQEVCGGCPWMPLEEHVQRQWKKRLIQDALGRIGGLEQAPIEEVSAPVEPLHYRNRLELTLGPGGPEGAALGFHPARSEEGLVDVDRCLLQHEAANRLLASAREFLLQRREVREAVEKGSSGFRLTIRRSWSDGSMLVTLREGSRPFPESETLTRHLRSRHPELSGVVLIRARPGRRGGARSVTLDGRAWLKERIGEIRLRIGAASFLQVSTPGACELVRLVTRLAGEIEGKRILDLYGGVGLFSLALMTRGAGMATICDADGEAIRCGRKCAANMGLRGMQFFHADAARYMRKRALRGAEPELIVANPPRSGLGPRVIREILNAKPPRLILVSCDPATLARDLRGLLAGGFDLKRVVPVDLFPQTAHVECVTLLVSREEGLRR
jgi:23S rRNA (uracil-5-)-methyltransferase RumA